MPTFSRRQYLVAAAISAGALVLDKLQAVAATAKPVRITGVDSFSIRIPISEEDTASGKINGYTVAQVDTDAGVRGYSFAGPSPSLLDTRIRPALVGQDLFAIERHLQAGLLEWGGLEHAIWDAIGKIAGLPVYRLLGGGDGKVKVYLTCVWPGNPDQSHVSYEQQVEMAVKIKQAGFHGMKIRAWRPRPDDDVVACGEIRAAVGPEFAIMFDRTAHLPQSVGQPVWDYETASASREGSRSTTRTGSKSRSRARTFSVQRGCRRRSTFPSLAVRAIEDWMRFGVASSTKATTFCSRKEPGRAGSSLAARWRPWPRPLGGGASFTVRWD